MTENVCVKLITDISNLLVSANATIGDVTFLLPRITIEIIDKQTIDEKYRKKAYADCANMFLSKLKETEE